MRKLFRIFVAIVTVAAVGLLLTTFVRDPLGGDNLPYIAEPQDDFYDVEVPIVLPTVEEVPVIEEPEPEPEPEPFIPPDFGFSTAPFMTADSFIDNDGAFLYSPNSYEFYYILDLPDYVEIDSHPELSFTGDDSIITPEWGENNDYILFSVNGRPFDGSAWFSFYVMFELDDGETLTRGGSITIVDDSTRLVWNHDGDLESFNESFSSIEHFMFDDDRVLTFKNLLIIEEGEDFATLIMPRDLDEDSFPVFVPTPNTRTPANAVVIRPVEPEEVRQDDSLRGMWAFTVNGWAVGDIVLTIDDIEYSFPVLFEPPEVGFSRSSTFSSLSDIITAFSFNPEEAGNTFYYVLPTELNTRGLNRNNIEVLSRGEDDSDFITADSDFITAVWARNNRSVRFTVNEMWQSPISIAFGLTNNAFGQIYGNIYHSSTWLEIVEES